MIPIPPIHCIMARHRCMPWLIPSTDSSTEAPVVVKPDIASKKESVMPIGREQNKNGTIPNKENTTHTMAVSR
ncbi:hypothetical protein IMSAGC008_02333 [Muribaculaceae bacterium]|nr:hypothetical protein IMSAGC008_02333 [Muribaculaceae bacterium]